MNEHDALNDLLRPAASLEPSALRERLLQQTSRLVSRRRMMRRLVLAGALAACLTGVTAIWYLGFRHESPVQQPPEIAITPRPNLEPREEPPPPVQASLEVSPVALEWKAFDSLTQRAERYFLAGNKYLEASQDMESALRCYAQALDACSAEELEIVPEDNWLVVSLKNARRKEQSQ